MKQFNSINILIAFNFLFNLSIIAMEKPHSNFIKLQCSDEKIIEVPKRVALLFGYIENIVKAPLTPSGNIIAIPLQSTNLKKMIPILQTIVDSPQNVWEIAKKEIIKKDTKKEQHNHFNTLINIIIASDKLLIPPYIIECIAQVTTNNYPSLVKRTLKKHKNLPKFLYTYFKQSQLFKRPFSLEKLLLFEEKKIKKECSPADLVRTQKQIKKAKQCSPSSDICFYSRINLAKNRIKKTLTNLDGLDEFVQKTGRENKKIRELHIKNNALFFKNICEKTFVHFTNLIKLDLSNNSLLFLPKGFFEGLQNLTNLNLNQNQLTQLPDEIATCKKLKKLNLSWNKFAKLPKKITKLKNLKYLNISENLFDRWEIEKIRKMLPNIKHLINQNLSILKDISLDSPFADYTYFP